MNVTRYLHMIPEIEARVRAADLDALVMGLGPTAWLTRWMDQSLFTGLRTFGAHDVFDIRPVDDLLLLDAPTLRLNPDCGRYATIVKSRPPRLHVNDYLYAQWEPHLPPEMRAVARPQTFQVWNGSATYTGREPFGLGEKYPETIMVSPTGLTTLAWHLGCRRIGVIGADMMFQHHDTNMVAPIVDVFMSRIAAEAEKKGGAIYNLSPCTSLQKFNESSIQNLRRYAASSACKDLATASTSVPS